MAKRYNGQTFSTTINGEYIEFYCYTTDTRNGFCHTVVCETHDITNTKVGYYNRTWERFTYETALRSAIEKLPKNLREGAKAVLIDGKAEEEYNKAERDIKAFEQMYNGLDDKGKKALAESGIEMRCEEDVKSVMGLMALMSLTK